jgi:membrane protease subunit HflC
MKTGLGRNGAGKDMKAGIALLICAFAVIGLSSSIFTVSQTEQALILQLGQPVGSVQNPGLHFKLPVVQEVRRFDRRILSVDASPMQMVISSSQPAPKAAPAETAPGGAAEAAPDTEAFDDDVQFVSGEPIIVQTFARYRITDPLKFMKTLRTVYDADQRVEGIMNAAARSALGQSTLTELLSPQRDAIMDNIRDLMNEKIKDDNLGIEIVDIRIVRADLTPELRQSTVRRMNSELKARATKTRAEGEQRALQIRATADKERSVLLAEAQKGAQIMRGEGDKEAIRIYGDAFSKDKEFYEFVRSMEAYKNTLATPDTRLILSPDSQFLRYLRRGD